MTPARIGWALSSTASLALAGELAGQGQGADDAQQNLRLTPQSRALLAAKQQNLSYYDKMALERRDDPN